ncbi:MAG: hypothetical protein ACOX1R_05335 [Caldicoprobacterales bacterium]|nr:hypothetical protein [Clostridiales bacterium]
MNIDQPLICPKCNGIRFEIKREATYLYTYKVNTPLTEGWSKNEEALTFLFDNRELVNTSDYIQCIECYAKYPCDLDMGDVKIHFTILQKAIRSDFQDYPEYLG